MYGAACKLPRDYTDRQMFDAKRIVICLLARVSGRPVEEVIWYGRVEQREYGAGYELIGRFDPAESIAVREWTKAQYGTGGLTVQQEHWRGDAGENDTALVTSPWEGGITWLGCLWLTAFEA